jgi:hypothetical protein
MRFFSSTQEIVAGNLLFWRQDTLLEPVFQSLQADEGKKASRTIRRERVERKAKKAECSNRNEAVKR